MIIASEAIKLTQTITNLSQQEATFLSLLAEREQPMFRFQEALDFWQDADVARSVLSRMQQGGWLQRIERGLYMTIPLAAGPQRLWTENALVIASYLLQPGAVAYWSALHYWNLTEQLPRTVFIQSPKRKSKREMIMAGVHYQFVAIRQQRFFGLASQSLGQHTVQFTDREKTLIDAADRPDLSGGIWQLVETLRRHGSELDWQKLDRYLVRFNSGAVVKRMGYLVEMLDLPVPDGQERLARWQQQLSTGVALLEPGNQQTGPVLGRWRIRDNVGVAARKVMA